MRVMVFAKATEGSEQSVPPTPEAFEAMDRFTEELVKAGVLVAGAGLKPSAQGKRIVCNGPGRTVIDGPFLEAADLAEDRCSGQSGSLADGPRQTARHRLAARQDARAQA